MHNFYNLNPNHQKNSKNSSNTVSLDLNIPLENREFYKLFDAYASNPSEENQNHLGLHLNQIHYLLGLFTDENANPMSLENQLTLTKGDTLKLLICSNDDREVFLPIFTDDTELKLWCKEPINTLSVPAPWLWQFVLRNKNYTGVVINPGSIAWCINMEQIQSLLDDIL